ncbi:restriction endonuclease subunit S [Pseudomonas sp. KU26590]|uniref:restriction endonuclease subunit S n=1 Tax=Pseudomonas sp. KU26590 TaxID=2991051 RepID=UPI00223D29CC|nr:restriction endonuclease subunit S [Pseudomonas sp. KU26590]UZJ60894.1 restriction endonuclease subunit S [Pseudomonas sp. KU26590]
MSELPQGWLAVTLGEVIDFKYGKSLPAANRDGGKFPVYGSNGIVGHHSSWLSAAPTIIIGRKGSVGEVCFSEKNCSPIDTTYYVDNFDYLSPKFCFYLLKQLRLSELNKSTAIPGLNRQDAYNLTIPLPPLKEQIRIAEKIDALQDKLKNIKTRIDNIPELFKLLRQSILSAATSGQLTEDWRGGFSPSMSAIELHKKIKKAHETEGGHARSNASEPTEKAHDLSANDLPEEWEIAVLRDICTPGKPITYGILKPGPELDEGVPYIRVADFPGNKLNIEGIKKTSPEIDTQYKRARLSAGDLLLSIRGSVGRLIKIPTELEGANITQDTARLSISPEISTNYVYLVLLANSTQRRMKNAIRGVAVRGINIGDVRALQIPLPTLDEQIEIARRVEKIFALVDVLECKVQAAKIRIDRLSQSILAQAFRGELVPHDLNDEPAAALLDRVKTQRSTTPKIMRAINSMILDKEAAQKEIISVVDALVQAGSPLTSLELLKFAGYSSDAGTDQMEQFFLDLRKQLFLTTIIKHRPKNSHEDWFSLTNMENAE